MTNDKKEPGFQLDTLEIMIAIREMRKDMTDMKKENQELRTTQTIKPNLRPTPGNVEKSINRRKVANTNKKGQKPAVQKISQNNNKKSNSTITIGSWNIRRGLLIRENEIKNILQEEYMDILLLVETDSKDIMKSEDYTIKGYTTIIQKKRKMKLK